MTASANKKSQGQISEPCCPTVGWAWRLREHHEGRNEQGRNERQVRGVRDRFTSICPCH